MDFIYKIIVSNLIIHYSSTNLRVCAVSGSLSFLFKYHTAKLFIYIIYAVIMLARTPRSNRLDIGTRIGYNVGQTCDNKVKPIFIPYGNRAPVA